MQESKKKILLVEDEPHLAFNMEFNLKEEGYDVIAAINGREALDKYHKHKPFDLILLDVMLPELSGFEVARSIRETDRTTGVLMLTARAAEEDVIKGLECGADDYITKPFSLKELLARIKRMAARSELLSDSKEARPAQLAYGGLTLDTESLELTCPQGSHSLTVLEAKVLEEFMVNPNRVLTRKHLLNKVWGVNGNVETRTVDNFVMRIRKYIESNPSNPTYLKSVRGRGYRFSDGLH